MYSLSNSSKSRSYVREPDSFLSFDLYGFKFTIYRSQKPKKVTKMQNNNSLRNECFSLPEHYCYGEISEASMDMAFEKLLPYCRNFEFCKMTTQSGFTIIHDPEEVNLFQESFNYCDCPSGFTVFHGLHKSTESKYKRKDILMALRMTWLDFIERFKMLE